MSNTLKVLPIQEDNQLTLKLSGAIDENAEYGNIDLLGSKHVSFNLHDIKMINSIGIQKWIAFFDSISSDTKITLIECNSRIINQINQFSGFFSNKHVSIHSFYAPYFCPDCDEEAEILICFSEVKVESGEVLAPIKKCENCSIGLEFDAIPKKYFGFVLKEY